MDKIVLFREIEDIDKEEFYYRIPQEKFKNFEEMQFVYFIKKEFGCKKISFARIVKIYDSLNFNKKVEVYKLKENEMVSLVSEEFIFYPILEEYNPISINQINNLFTLYIKKLNYEIKKQENKPSYLKGRNIY
nr:hypothetical protein [uncultured Aminipila sp.]